MDVRYDQHQAETKRQVRFASWIAGKDAQGKDIPFVNDEAESVYRARIQRFIDALLLEKTPDRVPIFPLGTFMPTDLCHVSPRDALYDYEKLFSAHRRYLDEYRPDYYGSPAFVGSGRVYDRLDMRLYRWPTHGVSEDSVYQCVESEYMKAEDYPALIDDPTAFWLKTYLPRIFGALAPLSALPAFPGIWEIAGITGSMIPFGLPPVQNALKALMDAGNEALVWLEHVVQFDLHAQGHGYPTLIGGAAKAPYDILADTLRGTQGIMLDLYRRPDMVLRALDRLLPLYIQQGVAMANTANNPMIFIPLHKGADGFMSDQQFRTFYWPTLKGLLLGFIQEGCVPFLFCEGCYDSRLEYLKELPRGTTFWAFDRTDMARAKDLVGDRICIAGNFPSGLLLTGTPDEVRAYAKDLIDTVGKGGGYVMCNGTAMDEGNAANLHALIDSTREYGVYRS